MTASTVKGYPRVWSLAVIVVVSVILREDSTFCVAAVNSGVIPQAFFDYLQQQQRQRTDPTVLAPTTFPPTQSFIPVAFQPSAPPSPATEPILPAEQPATSTFAPDLPLGDPYIPSREPYRPPPPPPPPPQPKPPPPPPPPPRSPPPPPPRSAATPVIPRPRQTPSTQQLLQFQDVIRRQQQQLERLKHEIAEQQRMLQQSPKPPPIPQLPKPAPSFPAPNYQFKPPPPQPLPPPPPRRLPPPVPTTQGGVIDFVPAEHKAVAPRPPPPRVSPTRYRVTGSMPRDWIARQISPSGHRHQHYHPLPSPQTHSPPPQAWHRPNLASGANPVTLLPRLNPNDILVKKFNPFSHMPLPRTFQSQAMSMGRKMCITQFYESHGCIDPVRYLPPGTKSQGLMMGCSHRASQQLCDAAGSRVPGGIRGRSKGLALAMMTRSPSSKALLEKCLSPNLVTNAIAKMMKGGAGGGMNTAAMMMMMGGGEGGGGMAALALMNLLNKQNGGASTSSTSLPEGAARPASSGGGGGRGGGGGGEAGGGGEECTSVLPLLMLKGVEGGMLSPEMASTVMNMRKQLLPYTCQDIHYGVFFRMCCPGKVHRPSMMEMMAHCGG